MRMFNFILAFAVASVTIGCSPEQQWEVIDPPYFQTQVGKWSPISCMPGSYERTGDGKSVLLGSDGYEGTCAFEAPVVDISEFNRGIPFRITVKQKSDAFPVPGSAPFTHLWTWLEQDPKVSDGAKNTFWEVHQIYLRDNATTDSDVEIVLSPQDKLLHVALGFDPRIVQGPTVSYQPMVELQEVHLEAFLKSTEPRSP